MIVYDLRKVGAEIIARRFGLRESAVERWMQEYNYSFRDVVKVPEWEIIRCVVMQEPLGGSYGKDNC